MLVSTGQDLRVLRTWYKTTIHTIPQPSVFPILRICSVRCSLRFAWKQIACLPLPFCSRPMQAIRLPAFPFCSIARLVSCSPNVFGNSVPVKLLILCAVVGLPHLRPERSALRCCFLCHRFIAFTRGGLFPLAYIVLSCYSYYIDTACWKTHPYPSSLFSVEPLVPAFPALFQCSTDAAKQFAVCMPVIVLYTLNSFSSYPGTECFVILTSCGANTASVVIVHLCHIAVILQCYTICLLTIESYSQTPSKFATATI